MQHLNLLYFFIIFSAGLVSLSIATFIYLKTKEYLLQYYLWFYSAFTAIIISQAITLYLRTNVPGGINTLVYGVSNYIGSSLARFVLLFTIPILIQTLFSIPYSKVKNAIFGGIVLLIAIEHHIFEYVVSNPTLDYFGDIVEAIVTIAVFSDVFLMGVQHFKELYDPARKALAIKFLILIGLYLPAMASDRFLGDVFPIQMRPLLYCALSIMFTHHLIKHYGHYYQPLAQTAATETSRTLTSSSPEEIFFQQYQISPREQEIVQLLLKGYSNQEISETLFISLNTVKTHLRNIYAKADVTSRYKLIALCKQNTA